MAADKNSPGFSNDRLELLMRLPQDLNTSLDPDVVIQRAMDRVIHLTGAERGFVLLFPETGTGLEKIGLSVLLEQINIQVYHGIDPSLIVSKKHYISHSIIEKVIQEGTPLLTSDAQSDDRFSDKESVTNLRLRSVMCVPLRAKEHILGVIYVDNRMQAGIFKPDDLELLISIAINAAVAFENARLFHQSKTRYDTLKALHTISEEITSTLDLEAVLTRSITAIRELLSGEAASILTLEGDELVFQVAVGEKASAIKPFRLPKGQGIAGWVVENKKSVIVNDVQSDPRFAGRYDNQTGFVTRTMITAPLILNEKAVGVINVINKPDGFTPEDLDLVTTFASSVTFAIENARLYQVALEKGRMEREMDMARKVQVSLLPANIPNITGWEFAAYWKPARQVSGDYYDFIALENQFSPDKDLAVIIADVADKGMPAALFMAMTRSTLRASTIAAKSVSESVTQANKLISQDSPNSMYVTLCLCQLNPASGEVNFVNAGHIPPIHFKPHAAQPITLLPSSGMPLGIDGKINYLSNSLVLQPGELLIMYTDGATDAFNPEGDHFGLDRLKAVICENPEISAAGMLSAIEKAVQVYMRDATPFDDLTMVVIKRV